MINREFYAILHESKDAHNEPIWTVERLAKEIYSSRSHVTQVLNNKPKRGHHTRWKLAQCIKKNFKRWEEMLTVLGWPEQISRIKEESSEPETPNVPMGTFHVECATRGGHHQ